MSQPWPGNCWTNYRVQKHRRSRIVSVVDAWGDEPDPASSSGFSSLTSGIKVRRASDLRVRFRDADQSSKPDRCAPARSSAPPSSNNRADACRPDTPQAVGARA
ncbi:hypothetical protein SCP_0300350 [Sparassis crispa]|uniref:Uncharacterized protein n=1 Tax=Sparassis crispa TaxID=139825 RepID=A0A401GDS6_9APHY|nr:hypothetical protein SCP_0300350 [Sparassis crispa]GBE80320.1 hypothetical protein SCP_0300350 [Sparassis crispa]